MTVAAPGVTSTAATVLGEGEEEELDFPHPVMTTRIRRGMRKKEGRVGMVLCNEASRSGFSKAYRPLLLLSNQQTQVSDEKHPPKKNVFLRASILPYSILIAVIPK